MLRKAFASIAEQLMGVRAKTLTGSRGGRLSIFRLDLDVFDARCADAPRRETARGSVMRRPLISG
jgi:hypothetical protein